LRTTSFLLDSDILIDAGTGVGDLSLAELSLIDYIFITHSHLDHVASIPFLVDTVGACERNRSRSMPSAPRSRSCATIFSTGRSGPISARSVP